MKHQRNCLIKLKENALLNKGLARDKMKEQIEKNLNALLHSKKGAELENELSQDSGL